MRLFRNLEIQNKLFIAFGLFVSLMFVWMIFSLSRFIGVNRAYDALINTGARRQIYLSEAAEDITKLRFHNLSRMYLLADGMLAKEIAASHKEHEIITTSFPEQMDAYRASIVDDIGLSEGDKLRHTVICDEIEEMFASYMQYSISIDKAVEDKNAQLLFLVVQQALPVGNNIEVKLRELNDLAFTAITRQAKDVATHATSVENTVLFVSVCITILSIILSLLIAQSIKKAEPWLLKTMAVTEYDALVNDAALGREVAENMRLLHDNHPIEIIEEKQPQIDPLLAESVVRDTENMIPDNEREHLRESLLAIGEACASNDIGAAHDTLVALRKKPWPGWTTELLNRIDQQLSHSDFDEAAVTATEHADVI